MARKIVIEIPHLPHPDLSLNARIHWTRRRAAMVAGKDEIGWLAMEPWAEINRAKVWPPGLTPPMARARISYEFHVATRRERDFDNLISGTKPYPDGLKAIGVIFKDDIFHLEYGYIRAVLDTTEKTVITVEELDE